MIKIVPTPVAIPIPASTYTVYSSLFMGGTCPWFTTTDGATLTYTYTAVPNVTALIIDGPNCRVYGTGMKNSDVGSHTVTITAYDGSLPLFDSFSYTMTVVENFGPSNASVVTNQIYSTNSTHVYSLAISSSLFSDPEGETMTLTCSVLSATSIITFSSN